ncbi:MAG: hypothetical protein K6F91_11035 [Ruminococcus sp.]|nr:hypothetical protein [Ruminococcus sp.]
MIMNFVESNMQNVYTPLNFMPHLVFCIIATVVYCTQYYRKHSAHYLLLALAVDGTFLTQLNTDSIFITLLGLFELAMLIAAGVMAHKFSKEQKAAEQAAAPESAAKTEEEHTPPTEKDDAVEKAFDD